MILHRFFASISRMVLSGLLLAQANALWAQTEPAAAPQAELGVSALAPICAEVLKTHPEFMILMARDPKLKENAIQLFGLVAMQAQQKKTSNQILKDRQVQALLLEFAGRLENQNAIAPLLAAVVHEASKRSLLPPEKFPPEMVGELLPQVVRMIQAELNARGATLASQGNQYETWMQLYRRVGSEIRKSVDRLRVSGQSLFENADFVAFMQSTTHSQFRPGNTLEILADGEGSFEKRQQAIRAAKESIDVLTWAFYDDATGEKFAKELVDAKKRGIRVRVIVDGQVAMNPKHAKWVNFMRDAGVETLFWMSKDSKHPFAGQHRKGMLVDGHRFLGGGRNFGDLYVKWRDTDVSLEGPVLGDFQKVFDGVWNGVAPKLGAGSQTPENQTIGASGARVALVDHHPGHGENILRSNLAAIEAATTSIDIENAYFILDPATYAALLRAHHRGVKVRVFTNSPQSVDEPIVSLPILRSVNRLVNSGIEVYIKKGETLHSKFLIVDGLFSSIGSYNFHPRSYRYEGEMIFNVIDASVNAAFRALYEKDLSDAIAVKAAIPVPSNQVADIGEILFYDQL